MDFTAFDAALARLGADLTTEIQAARDAITAAQGGDLAHLADAVTALNNLDQAVNTARAEFAPVVVSH